MKKKVTFIVKYTTEIDIEKDSHLSDELCNIEIPECDGVEYVCNSFNVVEIKDATTEV